MENKKQTIKMAAVILISLIFLFMVYITFFKAKAPSDKPKLKSPATHSAQGNKSRVTPPQTSGAKARETVKKRESVPDNGAIGEAILRPFKHEIKNIFFLSDAAKKLLESRIEKPVPPPAPPKEVVKAKKRVPLSEQEKIDIHQALQFKGSILSSTRSVAIINGSFFHVGDRVNGYKITSISEKKVNIDTGRGLLTLELMTHE
jgi:hypothetical protein